MSHADPILTHVLRNVLGTPVDPSHPVNLLITETGVSTVNDLILLTNEDIDNAILIINEDQVYVTA